MFSSVQLTVAGAPEASGSAPAAPISAELETNNGRVQEVAGKHLDQSGTSSTSLGNFAQLPGFLNIYLLSFLDLGALIAFSHTSKLANELAWNSIAKRIHCPIDKSSDTRKQVLNFIARIRKKAEEIKNRPQEITQILKKPIPTIDQIITLRNWLLAREDIENWRKLTVKIKGEFPSLELEEPVELDNLTVQKIIKKGIQYRKWRIQNLELLKARDAFVVWENLAETADLQGPKYADLATARAIIDKAGELDGWVTENQTVLTRIEYLDLRGKELTSIPKGLGNLPQLCYLNLNNNQITSVPIELGNLSQLHTLYLSDNQLTSVPKELSKLFQLRILYLGHNQLTSIPKELGNLSLLHALDLSDNQLTSAPHELGNLSQLLWLDLKRNQLPSIPQELGKLSRLKSLNLSENQLAEIPKELDSLSQIHELNLSENQLTEIPEFPSLKGGVIRIFGNPLQPRHDRESAQVEDHNSESNLGAIVRLIALPLFALFPVVWGHRN